MSLIIMIGLLYVRKWVHLSLHYNYIILFVKSKILIRDTEDEGRRLEGRARLGPRTHHSLLQFFFSLFTVFRISLRSLYSFQSLLTLLPQSFTIFQSF